MLDEFRHRFVDGTLAIFARHGWDARTGGLVERLTPDLAPDPTPYRRSMVHGRQLFVYAVWAERTGNPALADNADRIFTRLTDDFTDRDHGGWIESVDLGGACRSSDKRLYAHAFVLLGLSAYRHCLGRPVDDRIDRALDYIVDRFQCGAGLYHAVLDRNGDATGDSIDQNPLMHLLEALLFLSERAGRRDTLRLAGEIVDRVLESFLLDGLIVEHLGPDLRPHRALGHLAEPGHQAEWAWLLHWFGMLTGTDRLDGTCRALVGNALDCGWDCEHGGLFDQVERAGRTPIASTKRLWPLGELIKAASVFPDCVEPAGLTPGSLVQLLCDRYLHPDGRWTERLGRDMGVVDPTLPASSCYHLSFALVEALGYAGAGGRRADRATPLPLP